LKLVFRELLKIRHIGLDAHFPLAVERNLKLLPPRTRTGVNWIHFGVGRVAREAMRTGRPSTMGYERPQPVQSTVVAVSVSEAWQTGQTSSWRFAASRVEAWGMR
jgi:hypothetical protein